MRLGSELELADRRRIWFVAIPNHRAIETFIFNTVSTAHIPKSVSNWRGPSNETFEQASIEQGVNVVVVVDTTFDISSRHWFAWSPLFDDFRSLE